MPDREKVIEGLKCCLTLDSLCGDCPYYSYEDIQELECERNLRNDAIELLKEHESAEPDPTEHIVFGTNRKCSSCGKYLFPACKFCPHCGKTVKWE